MQPRICQHERRGRSSVHLGALAARSERKNWRNQPRTLANAKRLRADMTDAERLLWSKLRRKQMNDRHFRHQVGIGHYVADFACLEIKLIIEPNCIPL
jgi:very-short-patch-repair endonuclease